MLKEVFKIDENGYRVEKYVVEFDEEGHPIELLADNIITDSPSDGLYRARRVGTEWIEDMPQEEIDALNNQPRELTEIELLKIKLQKTEEATASTSLFQQDLLELLIEMGVI